MKNTALIAFLSATGLALSTPAQAQTEAAQPLPTGIRDSCKTQNHFTKNGVTVDETVIDTVCQSQKEAEIGRICKADFLANAMNASDPTQHYIDCLNGKAHELYGVDQFTTGELHVTITRTSRPAAPALQP